MKEDTLNKSLLNAPTVSKPSIGKILLLSTNKFVKKKKNATTRIYQFLDKKVNTI